MKRWPLLAALALAGCGGTMIERVNGAIDAGCAVCDTLSPLCSARTKPAPPVTVNVILPAQQPTAVAASAAPTGSVAP